MPKRELNINTDNILTDETQEDIILKSPLTIPDKHIQELNILRALEGANYSYYDIAMTEDQAQIPTEIANIPYIENDIAISSGEAPHIPTFQQSTNLNENMGGQQVFLNNS
ncbi:hypothetical protein [uncultured virus]|uniref:Uncharacterized protein n=1 Tax=uncultured virus TaxID=340016 RepID=A0A218MMP8_9VIRU|nr:hypothetical protein [uncultured virus]